MAPSKRRLERSPVRRRLDVDQLIEAFLAHHEAVGHSPATIRHYRDSLKAMQRCFTALDIPLTAESLTAANFTLLAGWLRDTPTKPWRGSTQRSIWGIHGVLKDCKVWVRWLADNELIAKAPKFPIPKLPQTLFPILSEDDLDAILSCTQVSGTSEQAIRNRAVIAFLLDTGVRLSEAANLSMANLNIPDGSARILGKGSKERFVYFSASTREALTRWIGVRGTEEGDVFWLTSGGIHSLIRRIKDETGLPMLTTHQFRHTSITMLLKQGVDLHTIRRQAGHASVTTTEKYAAMSGRDMQEKLSAASPFDTLAKRHQPQPKRRRLKAS